MNQEPLTAATILVVDDNRTNLTILGRYLEHAGFHVLMAPSGERALKQVQLRPPDLILLDIMMPGIDGYETCRRLKENPDTSDIPVIFITALSDLDDKVKAFQMGAVDYITKPLQREEVLARINAHLTIEFQKRALAELNVTKDKFFSIIAHDLRGSLGGLLGYSRLLAETGTNLGEQEYGFVVDNLHKSAQNTYTLMENLLHWATIQRGHLLMKAKELNSHELLEGQLQLLRAQAAQKSIEIENCLPNNIKIYADKQMVETIFRNLISNAIKFTHRDGKIEILGQQTDSEARFCISDNGVGIKAEHIPNLFRIDKSFKRYGTADEKGTGLGLMLCREMVERQAGRIWVESEPGQGTRVYFTLPLKQNENED